MECATAKILFEHYAKTAMENFEATDNLSGLVGQHGQFEEAKKYAEGTREKSTEKTFEIRSRWGTNGKWVRCADGKTGW